MSNEELKKTIKDFLKALDDHRESGERLAARSARETGKPHTKRFWHLLSEASRATDEYYRLREILEEFSNTKDQST